MSDHLAKYRATGDGSFTRTPDPRDHAWEPSYGFGAYNPKLDESQRVAYAAALEDARRKRCPRSDYGKAASDYAAADPITCDCKPGISIPYLRGPSHAGERTAQMTGCAELRELIWHLLHGDIATQAHRIEDLTNQISELERARQKDQLSAGEMLTKLEDEKQALAEDNAELEQRDQLYQQNNATLIAEVKDREEAVRSVREQMATVTAQLHEAERQRDSYRRQAEDEAQRNREAQARLSGYETAANLALRQHDEAYAAWVAEVQGRVEDAHAFEAFCEGLEDEGIAQANRDDLDRIEANLLRIHEALGLPRDAGIEYLLERIRLLMPSTPPPSYVAQEGTEPTKSAAEVLADIGPSKGPGWSRGGDKHPYPNPHTLCDCGDYASEHEAWPNSLGACENSACDCQQFETVAGRIFRAVTQEYAATVGELSETLDLDAGLQDALLRAGMTDEDVPESERREGYYLPQGVPESDPPIEPKVMTKDDAIMVTDDSVAVNVVVLGYADINKADALFGGRVRWWSWSERLTALVVYGGKDHADVVVDRLIAQGVECRVIGTTWATLKERS